MKFRRQTSTILKVVHSPIILNYLIYTFLNQLVPDSSLNNLQFTAALTNKTKWYTICDRL